MKVKHSANAGIVVKVVLVAKNCLLTNMAENCRNFVSETNISTFTEGEGVEKRKSNLNWDLEWI